MQTSPFRERLLREAAEEFSYALGNAALVQGSLDEAVTLFERALQVWPENPKARHNLALTLERAGRKDDAAALRRTAEAAGPGPVAQAWRDLADTCIIQNRLADAAEALRRAVDLEPDHLDGLWLLGDTLLSLNAFDEACGVLDRALAAGGPDDLSARQCYRLGWRLQEKGRDDIALRAYRRAARVTPDDFGPRAMTALALLLLGRLDEARQATMICGALGPSQPVTWWLFGWISEARGDLDQAEAFLRLCVGRYPYYAWGYINLAGILLRRERPEEAAAAVQAAQARVGQSLPRLESGWLELYRGGALAAAGRREQAASAFRIARAAALKADGDALYHLGPAIRRLSAAMFAATQDATG